MPRSLVAAVAVVALTARAFASGFDRAEVSPEGVGTAGAQTADADAPAAAYYDPAALAFQRGLTVQGGATIVLQRATATPSGGGAVDGSGDFATPAVFVGQRVAARYAVGIGVYDPFAWSLAYPPSWPGRFLGTSIDLRALDVNPSVALRPVPWLALGFGVDIVPTTLGYRHAIQSAQSSMGGSDGSFALDASATGVGGNASILVRALPRWLDVAFAYRSAVDVDLAGAAGKGTLPLPHTLTFAVASHPVDGLVVTTDVRITVWHDVQTLAFVPVDQMASAPDAIALGWTNTVGVRVGAAYRFWREHLTARLGVGWEQAPTSPAFAHPLFADGDRALAAAGVGARFGPFAVDAGYLAAIVPAYSGASGTFFAQYRAVTHTLAIALTLRLPDFGYHVDEPAFKR